MLHTAKAWLLAIRPKTLPAAVVPVWVGCVLAWQLEGHVDARLAWATLLGAVFIQIATNFFNDALDADKGADTEQRLGPRRVTASGLMSRRAVYAWGCFFLLLASVCIYILWLERGWVIVAIGLPSLFLAYGYTGGPWPLAYLGLGEVFVLLFFGLLAVAGTVFVQLGTWRAEALLLGTQIGLLSAVLISVNNYRDQREDQQSGKKTVVVRFGPRFGERLIALLCLLPVLLIPVARALGFWSGWWLGLALALVLPLGVFISFGVRRWDPAEGAFKLLLGLSALQLVLFALCYSIGALA